jgi:hypothetical protein
MTPTDTQKGMGMAKPCSQPEIIEILRRFLRAVIELYDPANTLFST